MTRLIVPVNWNGGLYSGVTGAPSVGTDQHRAALRESIRRRYRKLAATDLLAVYEQLDDARRALALVEVGLAGRLELHAQKVMAGAARRSFDFT